MSSSRLFQQTVRKAAIPTTAAVVTSSCATYLAERGTTNATTQLSKKAISTAIPYTSRYASSLLRQYHTVQPSKRLIANQLYGKKPFSTSAAPTNAAAKEAIASAPPPPPPPPSGATAAAAGGKGFLQWYESHLQASPVKTKMVTGGFLWGMGDFVAQVVPVLFFSPNEKAINDGDTAEEKQIEKMGGSTSSPLQPSFVYDYPRTARAVIFGFVIHAPCSHVHYNFLEWMTVRAGFEGLKIPIFKAFMEQFVYWSWFSNSLYHGAMGAMQGMTGPEIYDRIADVLWETQKAQWVFWIPVQLLNFQFVPVRHQLNVVLLTSIVWTALLSAWYPPQDEDEEKTKRIEEEKK